MGLAIYSDYQRALTYRGAVDFDDLIRLALDLLEADEEFLERLRYRFPYIVITSYSIHYTKLYE